MHDDGPQAPPLLPVAAEIAQIPLAPLAYSSPLVSRRPGILTAIGTISIILGCLSALSSLIAGVETAGVYILARMMPQITAASARLAAGPLTQPQVTQVIASVQGSLPNGLNPAQLQALTAALQDPNQLLLSPLRVGLPFSSASQDATGAITIIFNGRSRRPGTVLIIDATGQTSVTTIAGAANPFAKMNINTAVVAIVTLENIVSFGVAIYLFVAGILLLRGSPHSRTRHLRYAIIKIVLATLASIFSCILAAEFFAGFTRRAGSPTSVVVFQIAFLSLLSFGYPVALLIAMNSAVVRRYYEPSLPIPRRSW